MGIERLVEEAVRVGMDQEGAAAADEEGIGVRIRPDGGQHLGQPHQGKVQGDSADELSVRVDERLAVGNQHLRLQVLAVVLVPVAVGLGPAGFAHEFGQLVPVQIEVLVVVVALLLGFDVPIDTARVGGVIVVAREEVGLEGDGAAVQEGIGFHRAAGVDHHRVRRIQVAHHEPFDVVGGDFHVLEDRVQAEDRVLQHLAGPEDGLVLHRLTRLQRRIALRGQEHQGGEEHHPDTQARRERPADGIDKTAHGISSS